VLFILAAWALRRELSGLHRDVLLRQLQSYGFRHVVFALACTMASFVALGGIEMLALRYTGFARSVSRRSAIVTAFVAHAFSQSVGLALLTGAAVRLRAYSRYGLDTTAVARMSTFVTITVTLGLLLTGAGALLASSAPVQVAHAVLLVRPVGIALAIVILAYLAWSAFGGGRSGVLGRGRWRVDRPSPLLATGQLLLSALDWVLTGTVLYALVPPSAGVGYLELLRVYLVGQMAGMASHIPGGAGVFEVVVLGLLAAGGVQRHAALVASLLMFRVAYYLVPLVLAGIVAVVAELRRLHRAGAALSPPLSALDAARAQVSHVR
jgi:phosphatidylglycerol lysyltransferase